MGERARGFRDKNLVVVFFFFSQFPVALSLLNHDFR